MAIWKIAATALFLAFSTVQANAECKTLQKFLDGSHVSIENVFVASPSATDKIREAANRNLMKTGQQPMDIRSFFLTYFKAESGFVSVGVVGLDGNACVIDASIAQLQVPNWMAFMDFAKITMQDFTKLGGA